MMEDAQAEDQVALIVFKAIYHIFHRAVQGDGHPAGTGLGLAIVKGMVEANEGSVAAIDPPGGRGAAIRMILPAAPEDADA